MTKCSHLIRTNILEYATHRNARKVRKTYPFSKDWQVHESMTDFPIHSDHFC
jgi:hypothetical protein